MNQPTEQETNHWEAGLALGALVGVLGTSLVWFAVLWK